MKKKQLVPYICSAILLSSLLGCGQSSTPTATAQSTPQQEQASQPAQEEGHRTSKPCSPTPLVKSPVPLAKSPVPKPKSPVPLAKVRCS